MSLDICDAYIQQETDIGKLYFVNTHILDAAITGCLSLYDLKLIAAVMSCPVAQRHFETEEDKKDEDKDDRAEDPVDENPDDTITVSQMWQDFLHTLTLHGFRFVFERGPTIRKVLWLAILLFAVGMLMMQSKKSIQKYFDHPITTSVQVEFLEEIQFPAVTICNFNLFPYYLINGTIGEKVMSILAPQKYIDNKEEVLFARSPIPNFLNYARKRRRSTGGTIVTDDMLQSEKDFGELDEKFDFAEFVRTHGHRIDHMIKKCRWKSQPCGPENFTAVITEFGLCYTFNSGMKGHPLLKVQRAGVDYALRLQLSVQQDQYYGSLRDSSGFKVMVHDQEEPPLINELGIAIQPGTHTFCGLRKEEMHNLPAPFKTACRDMQLEGFKKYTKSACLLKCRADYVMKMCKCRSYDLKGPAPPCQPREVKNCVWPAMEIFRNESINCECPVPCEITKYQTQLSYAQTPAKHFSEVLARRKHINKDVMRHYLRDNFLELDVYFEEMQVTLIQQRQAYDQESLFGDIGGQVGLFLGASILTVLEFLDLLWRILIHKFKKRKNRKVRNV
ncbi:acid-sensing ion channel 2 [Nematostella vectensis]|uniref:acid-sensing ion channel 2 n=1 Tax=Nematostella vectensis TaxID=45351 RepID=UPI00207754AA|nr:acid-sensing ion channel 2 [Nematostella vectensis]